MFILDGKKPADGTNPRFLIGKRKVSQIAIIIADARNSS